MCFGVCVCVGGEDSRYVVCVCGFVGLCVRAKSIVNYTFDDDKIFVSSN